MYTLNIDDLDIAAERTFTLPRKIRSISALNEGLPPDSGDLQSIHLNGRVGDYPAVTFSLRQYGERSARHDPWYFHLVSDLSSHPIIFVGTVLDEPLLWQHIELRRSREPRTRELRPGSYLVTTNISAARKAILEDFNIQLIEMRHEEFAEEFLKKMETQRLQGLVTLSGRQGASPSSKVLKRVADARNEKSDLPGEFLLGREPNWGDIVEGTAVKREFESDLKASIESMPQQLALVTGTAGAGKSTTVMRLALAYQSDGKEVVWMNPETDVTLRQIRDAVRLAKADYLVIDDADVFGSITGSFLRDIANDNKALKVIAGMRSTKFERLHIEEELADCGRLIYSIPHLGDSDIDLLLDALAKAKRLGALRGLSRAQQVAAFERQAGRQLLVAMIQATSNERFEEKIDSECRELGPELGLIYSIVAIASSLRFHLTRDEIMSAMGDTSNTSLNKIQSLLRQRVLLESVANQIFVRHRVVADRAVDYYKREGQLRDPIRGLLFAIATRVHAEHSKNSRETKLLTHLMNHDFMITLTHDRDTPRLAYADIEDVLGWSYHYYLQRGSYEVEVGDINLAKNFLDQARAMAPQDYMVQTEWAYMTLKRAAMNAASIGAGDLADEAFRELEDAIEHRGRNDHYPYHVLGSQGLSWVRRAPMGKDEKARLLTRLRQVVGEGLKYHPKQKELQQLARDLQREHLLLATGSSEQTPPDSSPPS